MNKIKVLYDVFKTMKDKEIFKGDIKLEAAKDDKKIFSFFNEFEVNTKSGETKAKLKIDLDTDGKKLKHESNSEFNIKDCPHHKHKKGIHMHYHGKRGNCGIKAGFSKITLLLNVLNNVQIEEIEEKYIISLELKEILKEIKDIHKGIDDEKILEYHKHMNDEMNKDFCKHHEFIKEILCSEESNPLLKMCVNKNNEIEKIEISADGEKAINGILEFI